MNKQEFAKEFSNQLDISEKDAVLIINTYNEIVTSALEKQKRITMSGFGVFETRHRKARKGVNPQTKKSIKIPATFQVNFRPSKILKEKVNSAN